MGPKDEERGTLCSGALYLDREPITIGEMQESTLTAEEVPAQRCISSCQSMQLTVHFKPPKLWRCGNRKRFIKLVMSKGHDRNYAVRMANWARWMGIPYKTIWQALFLFA